MASSELQRLWTLAQIDNRIHSIRQLAANLDPGRAQAAAVKACEAELDEVGGRYRALMTEQKDLELQQASLGDKLKRLDRQLYGGAVVNAREADAFEKEMAAVRKSQDTNDLRLLELMDEIPPAELAAKLAEAKLKEAQARLAARRKAALEEKTNLETEFKRSTANRVEALKHVPALLMTRYETAKQRGHGIGMIDIVKNQACGGCGTIQPERVVQQLKDNRIVTCESCHRILFLEPLL